MAEEVPNLVKIIDVCRVPPNPIAASSNSTAQTTLPLTVFDIAWLRSRPTQRLFFCEFPVSKTELLDTILPQLKHSLSVTLQHYLPIAGNLTWPSDSDKPFVQYNEGDAVSLTVGESEEDFYHLSRNSFKEVKKIQYYLPFLLASETRVPVLALQVTFFPNAGFSIGHVGHHALFDGKSITMFMHSWASICRHGRYSAPECASGAGSCTEPAVQDRPRRHVSRYFSEISIAGLCPEREGPQRGRSVQDPAPEAGCSTLTPELTPFYDRTIVNDLFDMEKMEKSFLHDRSLEIMDSKAQEDTMLGTFKLSQTNIESMKKWVKEKWQEKHLENPTFHDSHPSTFAIAIAYAWACLIKTRESTTEKAYLFFFVNCRARLEPPIPPTYFGNCVRVCIVGVCTNELMEEGGVAIAARAIVEEVEGLRDGVMKGAKDTFPKFISIEKEGASLTSVGSSPRFEVYKTDFGWGRPRKVEMVIENSGGLSLSDSGDGNGGVEIGVALKKNETEAFASLFASDLKHHQILKS